MVQRRPILVALVLGSMLAEFALELPVQELMPLLFILFLSLFVLVGIFPAVQRTVTRIIRAFNEAKEAHNQSPEKAGLHQPWQEELPQLDVYESIVLRRLAMAGRKGTFAPGLVDVLGVDLPIVEQALERLARKNLVGSTPTLVAGNLYSLTAAGRFYAKRQGLVPTVRATGRSAWL